MDSAPLKATALNPPLNITMIRDLAGLELLKDFFTRCQILGWDIETTPLKDFFWRQAPGRGNKKVCQNSDKPLDTRFDSFKAPATFRNQISGELLTSFEKSQPPRVFIHAGQVASLREEVILHRGRLL